MKLITLNIWGGHIRQPLLEFIFKHQDVDIFCFQEVYHKALDKFSTDDKEASLNIFSEISELLPDHQAFFRPVIGSEEGNAYGIGMFVKKNLKVMDGGDVTIHHNPNYPIDAPSGKGPTHSRKLQWLSIQAEEQIYTIMNVHGLWNGMGKTDTPERIAQSQKIKEFMDALSTPKILCGDFNLRPETKSLEMLKQEMVDLIELYNVSSTRTNLYSKLKEQPFADYILTCPKIRVNHFEVLSDEVSDHAPLLLKFE